MEASALYSQWEHVLNEALRSVADGEAFLLIDAAQLPPDAMPWAECLRHGQVVNVSADEPEADYPEVCALLTRHDAAWVAALLTHYLPRKPFAFTALVATCGQPSLVKRLAQLKRVKLPDGQQGLLRVYDAAVLQALPGVLGEANRARLLACADAWVHLRRDGQMGCLKGNKGLTGRLVLTVQEREQLDASTLIDRVIATLARNGRLPEPINPFDSYRRITAIAQGLYPQGGVQFAPLYRCSALTAQVPLEAIQENWSEGAFSTLLEQGQGLYDAVEAWSQATLASVREMSI